MTDLGLIVVAAAVMKKAIAAADGDARERLLMMMDPGDRQGVWIDTPNGRVKAGSVTLTEPSKPKSVRKVTDRDAFVAWVKENRRDEIVVTESVRASYETAVLNRPEADEDGVLNECPPGVSWVETSTRSVIQVRPTDEAAAAIAAAVAVGSLSLADVLAIEGGES